MPDQRERPSCPLDLKLQNFFSCRWLKPLTHKLSVKIYFKLFWRKKCLKGRKGTTARRLPFPSLLPITLLMRKIREESICSGFGGFKFSSIPCLRQLPLAFYIYFSTLNRIFYKNIKHHWNSATECPSAWSPELPALSFLPFLPLCLCSLLPREMEQDQ